MSIAPPPPPPPGTSPKASRPIWKRWWFWVAVVVAVLIVGGLAGGQQPESQDAGAASPTTASTTESATTSPTPMEEASEEPTEEPSPTEPETSGRTFGDGTWVVGSDIKPGTYRAADAGGSCYWERLKSFGGGFNAIIANGNGSGGPIVVTIEKSDKGFASQDCGDWSSDIKTPVTESRTEFGDGYFIVGVDIAPGTYRVNAGNSCYWERLKNFTGEFGGIISNDNSKGSTIVQISGGDAGFHSQGCGTWGKV